MENIDQEDTSSSDAQSEVMNFLPSTTEIVERWNVKFNKNKLDYSYFKEHWRQFVPQILNLNPDCNCSEWTFNENVAKGILLDPLEMFMCDSDPEEFFNSIKRSSLPPSVCGRVFKMSEPTYNCRQCSTDPTCVLCVDCFNKSEHRHHKYKMSTSSGGGCCDCGDTEAWHRYPHCDIHMKGLLAISQEKTNELPKGVSERSYVLIKGVLHYAFQLLTLEHSPDLPVDLRILPEDEDDPLNFMNTPDTYCTILYNDETHTFENVINTLQKVLKVENKEAVEYVTSIDRIGRSVVKCSTFQHCTDLKGEIERITSRNTTRPLKVIVTHAHVIAHQLYAAKLLGWLQKVVTFSKGFRDLFARIILEPREGDVSLAEGILHRDSNLWKMARVHWHRLFITGMMMEYENKKAFAKLFTKNYGILMKEFIQDDHEHSVSIASISVQLYTVPSISHFLIAHDDVLFILWNTFLSECNPYIKNGKLEFERNSQTGTFKRSQYILYDLHYLLSNIPQTWTDELRTGFLQGFFLFLKFLSLMQGMDAATRQFGQHMEYEPEWETAFNLHMRLTPVITLMIKWCGTDETVLCKAYRCVLKKIQENTGINLKVPVELQTVATHTTTCMVYDVGTQSVSIHLPLLRLLAGLHLHLEKYNLSFNSLDISNTNEPTPEALMEPVLRAQVMIAQVHAGLWRRNGYSILHQIYFYHNAKCRTEMLDQDIVLLQIGACLIESNQFLGHILNKFKLIQWSHFNYEEFKKPEDDTIRQTTSLVEELLAMLIAVIGERYRVGIGKVTADDCIQKEIIQQLCVKPLSHSELNKELPDETGHHDTGLDRVIETVAIFKKPIHGSGKGLYELKPEFYEQYNVFYYHYTKEELSKSEEAQRKRRKAAGLLECCPPPPLPPLTESFKTVINLLQCDVGMHIIEVVLKRALDLKSRTFSESQLQRVLHLIGYGLHEEESQNYDFFNFTDVFETKGLFHYIEELSSSPRVESHKDLIKWTINKYKHVRGLTLSRRNKNAGEAVEQMEVEDTILQVKDENSETDRERRAKLAAEKRAKIMAQMAAMQNSFMKENEKLFEETAVNDLNDDCQMMWECDDDSQFGQMIALGENQTTKVVSKQFYVCILCQEKQQVKLDEQALVYGAYVQRSAVLRVSQKVLDTNINDEMEIAYLASSFNCAPFASSCGHVMHSSCWKKYFSNIMTKETRRPYRSRHPASYDVDKKEFLCPLCESLCNTVIPLMPQLNSIHPPVTIFEENLRFAGWLKSVLLISEQRNYNVKPAIKVESPTTSMSPSVSTNSTKTKAVEENQPIVYNQPVNLSNTEESDSDSESQDSAEPINLASEPDVVADVEESANDTIFINENDVQLQIVLYTGNSLSEHVTEQDSDTSDEISESVTEMVDAFIRSNYNKSLGVTSFSERNSILLCWKCCAFTIHAVERQLRKNKLKSILGDLTSRQRDCIEALVRLCAMLARCKRARIINGCAITLLEMVFDRDEKQVTGILDWDPFAMLVSLTMALPTLYSENPIIVPSGAKLDVFILKLALIASISQVIIGYKMPSNIFDPETEDSIPELMRYDTSCLEKLWHIAHGTQYVNTYLLWEQIKILVTPFLRCCVVFYHFLTAVEPSLVLTQVDGDTYENMCKYLGISDECSMIVQDENTINLFQLWCKNNKIQPFLKDNEVKFNSYLSVRSLIQLPEDYSELINSVSNFSCPNSDQEDSRNPTLCLVCGTMLCSQSYCCQVSMNGTAVGACAYHASTCGTGAGIFLRIRECEILLLSFPNRGCFLPTPYIDEYGETDQGLRRGNPLKLCEEKYKRYNDIWLNHSIHEEVSRFIESAHSLPVTQWHHL